MTKKRFFLIIIIIFTIAHVTGIIKASDNQGKKHFKLFAAGILPLSIQDPNQCGKQRISVILSKEAKHGFEGQGEWCDFSGGSDPIEDKDNSLSTAMREAKQEGRLAYVWKDHFKAASEIEKHIKDNITSCVIFAFQDADNPNVHQYGVMYLSNIKQRLKNLLVGNFKKVEQDILEESISEEARKVLLEKTDLLECDYDNLLAYANKTSDNLKLLRTTPGTDIQGRIILRNSFVVLLQSIKEENKVNFGFPVEMYVSSKTARFEPALGCLQFEDGFILTPEEKQLLCEKVKQDVMGFEFSSDDSKGLSQDVVKKETPVESVVVEDSVSWKSYRNLLFLLMIFAAGIGIYRNMQPAR